MVSEADNTLETLKRAERYLEQVSGYSSEQILSLSVTIDNLKECAYFFKQYASNSTLSEDFRYLRFKDELEPMAEKVLRLCRLSNRQQVAATASAAKQLHNNVMELTKLEGTLQRSDLRESLGRLQSQVDQYQAVVEDLQKEKDIAIAQVKSAKATVSLAAAFQRYTLDPGKGSGKAFMEWIKRLFYWGDNLCSLERKWAHWRSLWLSLLAIIFLVYLGWALWHIDQLGNLRFFIGAKLAFLPLILIVSICFAFASRNYRIHANLLAQYRHREIVATMLENIILNDALQDKDDLKLEIIREGGRVLFGLKNIGHLGKDQIEKMPIMDIIKEIKK